MMPAFPPFFFGSWLDPAARARIVGRRLRRRACAADAGAASRRRPRRPPADRAGASGSCRRSCSPRSGRSPRRPRHASPTSTSTSPVNTFDAAAPGVRRGGGVVLRVAAPGRARRGHAYTSSSAWTTDRLTCVPRAHAATYLPSMPRTPTGYGPRRDRALARPALRRRARPAGRLASTASPTTTSPYVAASASGAVSSRSSRATAGRTSPLVGCAFGLPRAPELRLEEREPLGEDRCSGR